MPSTVPSTVLTSHLSLYPFLGALSPPSPRNMEGGPEGPGVCELWGKPLLSAAAQWIATLTSILGSGEWL